MRKQFILIAMFGLCIAQQSYASSNDSLGNDNQIRSNNKDHSHHANHSPSKIGDHNHKQGEWMTSYRYSAMKMKGNRNGESKVSVSDVLADYMVAPTEMTMQMHMFGLMYGFSDKLTLMGMLPYKSVSMDHVTRMGMEFTTDSNGIGDVKLSGLYTLYNDDDDNKIILNAGISLPTGSIDERDNTPAGANQKLPYSMQ